MKIHSLSLSDLHALQRGAAAAGRQLVAVHDGAAGAGLGQAVALRRTEEQLVRTFLCAWYGRP